MTDDWLIMSRGLFFRPNAQGYTGIRDEAGRYSHAVAQSYAVHGEGTIVLASEAPEFTEAAYSDLVIKHLIKQRDALAEALAAQPQPQPFTGCQLRGPGECQSRGMCLSDACEHTGKTIRPRYMAEPREDGIKYPSFAERTGP